MAPLPDLSNEQKLTFMYHTLKNQESRHKRAMWYRFFKWLIIIGVIALLYTYPGQILGKVFEIVKPLVMEQTQSIMEENKNTLMKSLKDAIPDLEITPVKSKTTTPAIQTTKTKTGTTTPIKKGAPI